MAAAALAAAIAVSAGDGGGTDAAAPWRHEAHVRAAAGWPREVGGSRLEAPPVRIVAASVLSSEVLLAIAPRQRIAGVHVLAADPRYSEAAPAAASMSLVGGDPEQLIGVRPDLVLLDEFTRAEVPILLASVSIPTVRTRPATDFAGVADNVRLIGWATGCDVAAEDLVAATEQRLREVAAAGADVASWRVMNLNGALDTYGSRSLLDAAVRAAGARHLPAERGVGGYQKLDVETVLAWRPDALLVGDFADWLQQHPGLQLLPCVRRGRVLCLPSSLLGSTSHHAVEIAARLRRQLQVWGTP
jgi:ABC-type Fe3+-hydroxamate transport system substrate-binding protein